MSRTVRTIPCDCGRAVELLAPVNPCRCGRDYDARGRVIEPPKA